HVVVNEAETHPQTFGARAVGKRLASQRGQFAEVAHKIYILYLSKIDQNHLARGIEQFQLAFNYEVFWRKIPADRVAAQLANNHLLVRRRHVQNLILALIREASKMASEVRPGRVANGLTFMISFSVCLCPCWQHLSLV